MDLNKGNRRILVIDDDQQIWKAYQMVLSPGQQTPSGSSMEQLSELIKPTSEHKYLDDDFHIVYAEQGHQGFEIVQASIEQNKPFAIAFIDIRMPPGWDGVKTATRIREVDPNIEIVIVTAFSDHSLEEIVKKVGSPDKLLFYRKPFDPDALKQIAVSLTSKRQLARREETQRKALETILNTSPAAIFTVDQQKLVSSWNPSAERITGYTADEVIGKPCIFQELTDSPYCKNCQGNERGDGATSNRQLIIKDKSGTAKTISLFTAYIPGTETNPETIIGNFWDITAIKNTEIALSASESRFRALVETTSDLVWEVDVEGRFNYCSPLSKDLYGYDPEELLGKFLFEMPVPADPSDTTTKEIFAECVRNGSQCRATERVILKKNGEVIIVESSGTPVFNSVQEVIGFRGIDRDITIRKKAEEERIRLEEQYRQAQKLEALGTLAGGISHDLNNILTPIIGYCQICLMDLGPDHPLEQSLKTIEKCALKASDLIRQILAFSRKQKMDTKPVVINDLINDFTKMLRRLIREDIELNINLDDSLWHIEADPGQIEQILINLVVNARDAMPHGGLLNIHTENHTILPSDDLYDVDSTLISGDFVVLTTSDNGTGIPAQTMELIFDPFFTTKDVGKGTGLGLATVHGIVLKHNGHIRLESETDKGTSFQIFLPKTYKKTADVNADTAHSVIKQGNETLLIVEDAEEVLMLLSKIMQESGYTVLKAENGIQAMEVFKEHGDSIDLLVTDLIMPGMGGRELAKSIKESAHALPTLYMSGHSFDEEVKEIATESCSDFIQKPFALPDFTLKVRHILDNC